MEASQALADSERLEPAAYLEIYLELVHEGAYPHVYDLDALCWYLDALPATYALPLYLDAWPMLGRAMESMRVCIEDNAEDALELAREQEGSALPHRRNASAWILHTIGSLHDCLRVFFQTLTDEEHASRDHAYQLSRGLLWREEVRESLLARLQDAHPRHRRGWIMDLEPFRFVDPRIDLLCQEYL